jgi:hypothetical protein
MQKTGKKKQKNKISNEKKREKENLDLRQKSIT